ncbi:hypothetical protein VitviT2T_004795 [Vitis vinifera]|uniref:BSD2 cysteine rich domain-containing protein n=2 Tax=Vitis vinifera TaxID=29760 RepID=A0ABY9BRD0_VITVI|nr:protein BUNDLE SHEATH DEFECTIVE 2, chloroplastic [Vitis vinifera]WJZ85249.1 hypothetical protein VitviT2T_004795 [Vitis vinifera]|eukprot:XP_003631795.1 PREDICTED: uncharacterized protein LOC100854903 [Vitis vinifera]
MSELSIYLLVDGGEVLLLSPTPMASAACLVSLNPFSALLKPGVRPGFQKFPATKFSPPKAAQSNSKGTKPNSVVCADCDGNGAVLCSQCKGSGVNSVDFFNGQFKAGESCWLCGGKKDILCGNCNGAGFVGGFMSTFDE